MTELRGLASVDLNRDSRINGATTTYTWRLLLSSYVSDGDFVTILTPQNGNVTFNSINKTECQGLSQGLS